VRLAKAHRRPGRNQILGMNGKPRALTGNVKRLICLQKTRRSEEFSRHHRPFRMLLHQLPHPWQQAIAGVLRVGLIAR
jgi:hypothetical protein